DRAGLDQRYVHVGAAQLQPQRVAQSFEGVLGSVVGAAIGQAHEAEHRADLNDTAFVPGPEDGQEPGSELVRAVNVGFELRAKRRAGEVLDRARLAVAGVIDERVQPVARPGQDVIDGRRYRFGRVE